MKWLKNKNQKLMYIRALYQLKKVSIDEVYSEKVHNATSYDEVGAAMRWQSNERRNIMNWYRERIKEVNNEPDTSN